MKNISLVFYDLDGTLIDSIDGIVRSVQETLHVCGYPPQSKDAIQNLIGGGVEELLQRASGASTSEEVQRILTTFNQLFGEIANAHSRLYTHTISILQHFSHKKQIIVTNRREAQTRDTLRHFKIDHYFCDVIGSDDITCRKPTGCQILRMVEKYAVSPHECIMVGDMTIDIRAGKDAKVVTCAVTTGLGTRSLLEQEKPDYLIDDISILKEVIC